MKKEMLPNSGLKKEEIDLMSLVKALWENRKILLKITGIFALVGLTLALLLQKEYTSSSIFIPQTERSATGGNLDGLASLAGINIGGLGTTSEIPPSLYPKIIGSVKYKRALLKSYVTPVGVNKSVTYKEYYENFHSPGILSLAAKYTIGLPKLLFGSINNKPAIKSVVKDENSARLIQLTQEEVHHFKRLDDQIKVVQNEKEGTVELHFTMPQALMAAEMAKTAEELLQKEVIAYKIQNAREHLIYIKGEFEKKKAAFEEAQIKLAKFRDRNQYISSAVAKNQLQSLETEYNFAFNMYTEMAKQLEQSKLQVSKNTPVFAVINPVNVPMFKSAPKRFLIIMGFTVAGLIFSILFLFIRSFYEKFRTEWQR